MAHPDALHFIWQLGSGGPWHADIPMRSVSILGSRKILKV